MWTPITRNAAKGLRCTAPGCRRVPMWKLIWGGTAAHYCRPCKLALERFVDPKRDQAMIVRGVADGLSKAASSMAVMINVIERQRRELPACEEVVKGEMDASINMISFLRRNILADAKACRRSFADQITQQPLQTERRNVPATSPSSGGSVNIVDAKSLKFGG